MSRAIIMQAFIKITTSDRTEDLLPIASYHFVTSWEKRAGGRKEGRKKVADEQKIKGSSGVIDDDSAASNESR